MKIGILWGPVAAFAHLGRDNMQYSLITNHRVIKWQSITQTCENISNRSEVGICISPFVVQIAQVHIQLEVISQHLSFLPSVWHDIQRLFLFLLYFPFEFLLWLVFHLNRSDVFPLPVSPLPLPFLGSVNVVPKSVVSLGQSPHSSFHYSRPVAFCSFSPAVSVIYRENNQNDSIGTVAAVVVIATYRKDCPHSSVRSRRSSDLEQARDLHIFDPDDSTACLAMR